MSCTTCLPRVALPWLLAETDADLVAFSEFFCTIEFISSIEAAVSSKEAACSVAACESCSLDAAKALIEAAEAKSQEISVPMAIAIVDDGGLLKAFHRMDGLDRAVAVDLVPMKAYTAVSFRAPTHMLAEGAKNDVVMAATLATTPHFTLLGGGYPIMDGQVVVGGLGVGGGSVDQDMQVAEAALAAVGGM